jgi:lipid A 3-O-deacylase
MKAETNFRAAALVAAALLAVPVAARADSAGQSIWTLQDENSSISTTNPTDRFYVNGLHLNWTGPQGFLPGPVSSLGHALFGDGEQRVSVGLTQQIYTPYQTKAYDPPLDDEPYAGYLVMNLNLIQDSANTRSVLGVNLGVLGPGAGGQSVQNGFHAVIGQDGTNGWRYQLPNVPAVDFLGARIWRLPLGHIGGLETDALPQLSGMAGLTAVYLQPAIGFRIGSGLESDYGPPLLAPSPSGADAYTVVQPFAWYLFASSAAKLVGYDEVLEGTYFKDSRSVPITRLVGSFEIGGAIIWRGLRFSYTQMFQTSRFQNQKGDIHEFGSFSVSGMF